MLRQPLHSNVHEHRTRHCGFLVRALQGLSADTVTVIDSTQLTTKTGVSTPVNWKPGEDVVIPAAMPEDEARKKFPGGWKILKPYLRCPSRAKLLG